MVRRSIYVSLLVVLLACLCFTSGNQEDLHDSGHDVTARLARLEALLDNLTNKAHMIDEIKFENIVLKQRINQLERETNNKAHRAATGVHFYVQRSNTFSASIATIPFEIEQLNMGSGMNLTSGIFTAPLSGIYSFSFSGMGHGSGPRPVPYYGFVIVALNLNGVPIAYANSIVYEATDAVLTASLRSILRLKAGDEIKLVLEGGELYEAPGSPSTHFTGTLLEEDVGIF